MNTTQVTLRNVDIDLKRLIDQHAKKRGKSINTFLLELIARSLSPDRHSPTGWRELAGSMSDEAFDSQSFDYFELIDQDMWK